MRIASTASSPRRRGSRLVLLLVIALMPHCATMTGKSPRSTTESTITKVPGEPTRETMKPTSVNYAAMQGPKRQVSTHLVEEGKTYLAEKNYDHARSKFEEAVNVDPTNGSAYYHLAVVYYNLNDFPKALGFLDQAENLFHASPEWEETIQKFREMMR